MLRIVVFKFIYECMFLVVYLMFIIIIILGFHIWVYFSYVGCHLVDSHIFWVLHWSLVFVLPCVMALPCFDPILDKGAL